MPAFPLLDIYSKRLKAGTQINTWAPVFIAALFTIAKRQKEPKFPLTDKRKNKTLCVCVYIYIYTHAHTHIHKFTYVQQNIIQLQK